jgi:heterodisulfide reductase subunit A
MEDARASMKGSVLVVGAGPAGMRASFELLNQGFKVVLIEEKPTVGGKMAQIDKMYPSNECATCTILPRMLELTSDPNMTIVSFANVTAIQGEAGNFRVRVAKKPRYVNPAKCTACTDCFPVCPVGGVPMEFDFGRAASKAISFYSPFPPRKALINPERCEYLLKGSCGDKDTPPCVEACKPEAIDFLQKIQEVEFNVGAIILAVGMDEVKSEGVVGSYGHGTLPNVITALEYERLLSGLGPTGGVVKRSDSKEPKSVAWLVLDEASSCGFMSSVAQSVGTMEKNPDASVYVIYKNFPHLRTSYDSYYQHARERGVMFVRGESATVTGEKNGDLVIEAGGERIGTEMLVLAVPLAPSKSVVELGKTAGIEIDGRRAAHTTTTLHNGIFLCGAAAGAEGIDHSIVQACSAAANAAALLSSARGTETVPPPERKLLPVASADEPAIAAIICRCGKNIAGIVDIEEVANYVSSLPNVTKVELTPFGCDGVKLKELLKTGKYNRVVMGACSPKTHEPLFELYAENSGLNRHLLEIVNVRNHCTWVHSNDREKATQKTKTLMRMGVERCRLLEPLEDLRISVTPSCLVVGGTPAGIACALKVAEMGLQVYLVEIENSLDTVEGNGAPAVRKRIAELGKNGKMKICAGAKVGKVEGSVGNYKARILAPGTEEEIAIGSVVLATGRRMGISDEKTGADYEKDLLLQRDEEGNFVGMLGLLNPQEFNTEGVFRCGSARASLDIAECIMDGEAAASRVAGIISKKEMIKSPRTSFVVDANCDGCAYCIEPCPAHAITLIEYMRDSTIKKTVQVNEAICRGCGICMATCPKKGIYVRHFKPEYFAAMVNAVAWRG